MIEKQYKNIREVSKLLNIKEHVIRHWDSINPKTKKIRFKGLSTRRNKGGTRYFNIENIKRLEKLKSVLFENNGKHNYSLDLANKILSSTNIKPLISKDYNKTKFYNDSENLKRLNKIVFNLKNLLK